MTTQITNAGPLAETLGQREAALQAEFLAEFPPVGNESLDVSPDSYTGREIAILSEQLVSQQNLLLRFVDLLDPEQAQGVWVDFHLGLQGTRRKPATFSTIAALVYGTPGTNVGDRRVRYTPTGSLWRTPLGLTIGANGITPTTLTAVDSGPVDALQTGTQNWVIVDNVTVGSWTAVESTARANQGTTVETDPAARRRVQRSAAGGSVTTKPAIVKGLLAVDGVTDADINNNRDLVPDANGVPGKSIEAVVEGGTDLDVATACFRLYGGTAGFFGNTTVDVTENIEQPDGTIVTLTKTVKFTRPELIPVVARYTVTYGDASFAPDNAEDLVRAAAANYINNAGRGVDVVPGASASAAEVTLPAASEPTVVGEVAYKGDPLGFVSLPISVRQRATINPQPQSALVEGSVAEPFNFNVTWLLVLSIDGGSPVTVSFAATDFAVVSAATALEVATAIGNQVDGIVAGVDEGVVALETLTTGATSSIQVLGTSTGALLLTLGLSVGTTTGSDGDIEVVFA